MDHRYLFDETTPNRANDSGSLTRADFVYANPPAYFTRVAGVSGLAMSIDRSGNTSTTDSYFVSPTQAFVNAPFTLNFWVKPFLTHQIDTESTSSTDGVNGQRYIIGPVHSGNSKRTNTSKQI